MDPLFSHIQNLFEIEIISAEKIDGGFLTNNQKITTKDNVYFLKEYRSNVAQEIQEMHNVKKFFEERGIPVIFPIKNKTGETYFSFNDTFFAVFPFITDAKIIAKESLTETNIKSLAIMLAQMHILSKNGFPEVTTQIAKKINTEKFFTTSDQILEIINQKEINDNFDVLTLGALNYKREHLKNNKSTLEDFGLQNDHIVHGDYHDQNVFFDDEGNVKYVFDFEMAKLSPRVRELVRSLGIITFDTGFEEMNYEYAKIYLQAYNTIYPISKEELEKGVRYLLLENLHSLWVEQEHYLKGNTRVDHFLANGIERTKYINENLEFHIHKLLSFI